MNKYIATMLAAALGLGVAQADMGAPAPAVKDMEVAIDEVNYVETAQKGIILTGFVDAGYSYNFGGDGAAARNSTAVNPAHGSNKGDFSLNQVYLSLEKPLSDANELQGGFFVGLMMGEDVGALIPSSNAVGGNSSDFAVEEAYVMLRLPYGNGIDMKVGKFSTLLGYEVNHRKDNMNISFGSDYFSTTSSEVGVEFYYAINDNLDYTQRFVNGQYGQSDNSIISTGTPVNVDDDYGFEGLLGIHNDAGNASIYAGYYVSIHSGGFGAVGTDRDSSILGSINGTWMPKFANDKLTLAFSYQIGDAPTDGVGTVDTTTTWMTTSLYAKYQFTELFSLASRFNYSTDSDGTFYGNNATAGGADLMSFTLTAGFDLTENLLFRAEYRHDNTLNSIDTVNGTDGDVHFLTAQVVYSF